MRGFQLWINLPAQRENEARGLPRHRPREIPVVALRGGGRAKVIAGTLQTGRAES